MGPWDGWRPVPTRREERSLCALRRQRNWQDGGNLLFKPAPLGSRSVLSEVFNRRPAIAGASTLASCGLSLPAPTDACRSLPVHGSSWNRQAQSERSAPASDKPYRCFPEKGGVRLRGSGISKACSRRAATKVGVIHSRRVQFGPQAAQLPAARKGLAFPSSGTM